MNQQFEEFHRLTAVFIWQVFFGEVQSQGHKLLQIFRRKKKSTDESTLLSSFEETSSDLDEEKKLEAEMIFGIYLIPYLLNDARDCIFKVVSYNYFFYYFIFI